MEKSRTIQCLAFVFVLALSAGCANGFARTPFPGGDGAPASEGGAAADSGIVASDGPVAQRDSGASDGSVAHDGAPRDSSTPSPDTNGGDSSISADGSVPDGFSTTDVTDHGDTPQGLTLSSSKVAGGWYQYYSGSTQYRPAGEFFDLALDSQDRPHLFHGHSHSPFTVYRHLVGSTWEYDGDVTDDRYGYSLNKVQIALDGSDLPTVLIGGAFYVDYPTYYGGLHSYRFDSYKWLDEHAIESTSRSYEPNSISLALDAAGHAHVAYYGRKPPGNSSVMALIYAHWDGSQWVGEEVDTGDITRDEYAITLALDGAGEPHLVYLRDQTPQAASDPERVIVYARKSGGQWSEQVVEDYLFIRQQVTMALGPDGRPHIAYADEKGSAVFYNSASSGWSREKVDEQGDVGWGLSLDVDDLGRPHISHIDRDTHKLRYARKLVGGWDIYRPDTIYAHTAGSNGGNTQLKTVLKVDSQHLPHILVGGFNLDYVVGSR